MEERKEPVAVKEAYLNFYPAHQIDGDSLFDFFVTVHATEADAGSENISCARRLNGRAYKAPFTSLIAEGGRQ